MNDIVKIKYKMPQLGIKYGKLQLKNIPPSTAFSKKVTWMCDCGREKDIMIFNVVKGVSTSCGRCNMILATEIGLNKLPSIRPSKCDIKLIKSKEANDFYNSYHYIGPCRAKINYGVFKDGKLIVCISFSNPTRQSKWEWELIRMASSHKIHGIWSKLLNKFINEQSPFSIVSFSDDRFFSGIVYERMGFKFDGKIPPDYYWVKENKRCHKSRLRKTKLEKLTSKTETVLRMSQGYRKIWDLGKKRWVWVNTELGSNVA